MNVVKRVSFKFFLILLLVLISLSVGCARQDKPEEVLRQYLKLIQEGEFPEAYELLTLDTKEKINDQRFILWHELSREIVELKDFQITLIRQGTNIKLGEKDYSEFVEFEVEEENLEYYLGMEHVDTSRNYVVKENQSWKLYLNLDIEKAIAQNYFSIGQMYIDGYGKDIQVEKAADYFKATLDTDPSLIEAHYSLGVAYMLLGQYDDSIQEVNTYIEKSSDAEGESEAYNILGLNYLEKGKLNEAKAAFEKALELNPENTYAIEHLEGL